jgi:hypothetical protein
MPGSRNKFGLTSKLPFNLQINRFCCVFIAIGGMLW